MITAEEFAELNQYDLEYYDEGGYQGVNTKSFANKLIEFAKLHVTEALNQASDLAIDNGDEEIGDEILKIYPLENIK